jgi:type II secretory pathway component PulF
MDIFSTAYPATQLTSDVSSAVQTTFASLAPVLAVVVGLILTFIVARYVITLFRHAGRA